MTTLADDLASVDRALPDIKVHPLAELIPPMTDAEYADLKADIGANGQREPITLYRDQILDGRHRYRACRELGIDPKTQQYTEDAPAAYVISLNVKRRSLTTGQLAAIAVEFLPALEEENRERQKKLGRELGGRPSESEDTKGQERSNSRSYRQAGEMVGVGEATVGRAKRVKRDAPEEFERLRSGETTVTKALGTLEPTPPAGKPTTFVINGKRGEQVAGAAKLRVERAVGNCNGLARGLGELNVEAALAVATPEEVKGWLESFRDASAAIKQLRKRLEGAS